MLIGDIFERQVTRDINPVVYFHEQDPAKVAEEVSEYIITGGYPAGDPRANAHGIHEQFVRLLSGIAAEVQKPGGPENPAAWISGFFGSGKSSFAKLLGLSLNGMKLPDGTPLAEALLKRDSSARSSEFVQAWHALVSTIKPMAVVFDIGSAARDDEHIHAVVVRECQKAMGYCSTSSLVADYELKLEADGVYEQFLDTVRSIHGKPWMDLKDKQLAEDHFSAALYAMSPELYGEEMAWIDANAGRKTTRSAEEAVKAIEHMLSARKGGRTLFFVVDEVSQYVHEHGDRQLALQSLVSALKERLKGKAWLLATGQQKLEEGASATASLGKMKDRFPTHLRVHLSTANIRDVVHQRLLKKKPTLIQDLEQLYKDNSADLSLYAYQGDQIHQRDFVEVYPMLPGQIDLLMSITTGLRARSSRVQGDSHAIRGLLQLLGDLFRNGELGRLEFGRLITLDLIYDVLHTALNADVQTTLSRAFDFCRSNPDGRLPDAKLAERVIKAVALLELIEEERVKVDADLVARCLYERVGQGSQVGAVQDALTAVQTAGFFDYSEKRGFKIQSSAGQEWQKERDSFGVGAEKISKKVQEALTALVADVPKADLDGLGLPWQAWYSDDEGVINALLKQERSPTKVEADFRFLRPAGAKKEDWVPRSDSTELRNRVVWVAGDVSAPDDAAKQLARSERMVERYTNSEASLEPERRRLLTEERNRKDAAARDLKRAVEKAFLTGTLYFRGKDAEAAEEGTTFSTALKFFGDRAVKKLYPTPVSFRVVEGDLKFLIESADLAAPPQVLGEQKLGILAQDSGRYEASCTGAVPAEIFRSIDAEAGISGSALLSKFGGPPHGYSSDIVKTCVVGLLRGRKIRVRIPGVGELTSTRDEGSRELIKDQSLRKAEFFPNKDETINQRDRNAICKLFQEQFQVEVARDDNAIADAVPAHFSSAREQLSELQVLLARLPGKPHPDPLTRLEKALESCRRDRKLEPTLKALKRNLGDLRDGLIELRRLRTDVTEDAVSQVTDAGAFREIYAAQLQTEADAHRLDAAFVAEHLTRLTESLQASRPWECTAELADSVMALRKLYTERRQQILSAHATRTAEAVSALKLRDGFDTLNQDQQHRVLQYIREGAPFDTTPTSPAPDLETLETQFPLRLQTAIDKALAQLDEFRETEGEKPTVTVALRLTGREIDTEDALDRLLEELRQQLLKEIQSGHRVRLK